MTAPSRRAAAAAALGLALLVLALYARLAGFDFVEFDDDIYVTANPDIRLGLSAAGIRWAFTTLYAAFWHPVTWLSLLADFELFGLRAGGFHATSVVLHLLNTLLLLGWLRAMTGSTWRSAFVAALFAVHPLHVESVAWVAERKDVLSTFFWFAALWAYAAYARRPGVGRYLAVLLAAVLGLMAKPMLVTLPAVLLILDYWPLGRLRLEAGPGVRRTWVRLAAEKLPFLALAVVFAAVAVAAQARSGAVTPLERTPLAPRLANAVASYGVYVCRAVWPAGLASFYPFSAAVPAGRLAAGAAILAAGTLAAIGLRRRAPWFAAGWAWYVVTLVPVVGLIQVGSHAMADRFTYVPLIGLFWALAWGAERAGRRWLASPRARALAAGAAAAGVLGTLSVAAWRQTTYWSDTVLLFERTLAVTGGNPMIESNLGAVLFKRGRREEALEHCRRAVALNPRYASGHNNLGVVLADAGRAEEALEHYRAAVELEPGYGEAHGNLGTVLLQRGDLAEAGFHLERAVALKPADSKSVTNLGSVRFNQGRLDEALDCYQRALALDPGSASARFNAGVVLELLERPGEAAAHYAEAYRLRPDDGEAFTKYVHALSLSGRLAEARALSARALAAAPSSRAAQAGLAWTMAADSGASGAERQQAVSLAEAAAAGTGEAWPLGVLAAAYACAGRYADAAAAAGRALEAAERAGDWGLARELRQHHMLYVSARPLVLSGDGRTGMNQPVEAGQQRQAEVEL